MGKISADYDKSHSDGSKMRNGFNIVIGGNDFDALKFVSDRLEPQHIQDSGTDKFLEFNDFEEGEYSLDMIAEASDYLKIYYDYFKIFKHEPTVEYKTINFFIECSYESLYFDSEQINLLNDLGFTISFTFAEPKQL